MVVVFFFFFLQRLFELGARKVLVSGTGPLGCVPAILARHNKQGECATELQQAAGLFNPQLIEIVSSLNKELGNTIFITIETNLMHINMIDNPKAFGNPNFDNPTPRQIFVLKCSTYLIILFCLNFF